MDPFFRVETYPIVLTLQKFLDIEYGALVQAQEKITGNHELGMDLLHYAIEEMSTKPNLQDILDSGGGRFYLVRIMMVQWRSQTGPFHRNYMRASQPLDDVEVCETEESTLDVGKINLLLQELPWYDRELWNLYVDRGLNYSDLSRETNIPRTSISLTIRRVREYLKKNL